MPKIHVKAEFNHVAQTWLAKVWLIGVKAGDWCVHSAPANKSKHETLTYAVEWLERSEYNELTRKVDW